jgi:hypothetical protein
MSWSYRFFEGRIVECYYDKKQRPDSYCESRFYRYLSPEASEAIKHEYVEETKPNLYMPGLVPDSLVEFLGDEPRLIKPDFEGTFREFAIKKWLEIQTDFNKAIEDAIAYEEAGYPPLEEEFQKPIEDRTPCPGANWVKLGGKQTQELVSNLLMEIKKLGIKVQFKTTILRGETTTRIVEFSVPMDTSCEIEQKIQEIVSRIEPSKLGKPINRSTEETRLINLALVL